MSAAAVGAGVMANPLPLRGASSQGGGGSLTTRSGEGSLLGGGGDGVANFATGERQQQKYPSMSTGHQHHRPPSNAPLAHALLPFAPLATTADALGGREAEERGGGLLPFASAAVGVRSPQRGGPTGGATTSRRSISIAHSISNITSHHNDVGRRSGGIVASGGGGLPMQLPPPTAVSYVHDVGGAASGGGGVRAFAHDDSEYARGAVGVRAANASAPRRRASSEAQPHPLPALPLEPLVSGEEEGPEVREGGGNGSGEVGDDDADGKPLPLLPPFVAPFPHSSPPPAPAAAASNDGARRGPSHEGFFATRAGGGERGGEGNGSSSSTVGCGEKKRKDDRGGAAAQRSASEGLLIQNILSKLIVDDPISPEDAALEEAAEFLLPSPSSAPPLPPPSAAASGGGGLLRPQPKAAVLIPFTAADTNSNAPANNINTNVTGGVAPTAATASIGSRTGTPAATAATSGGVVLTPHALLEAFGANQQRLLLLGKAEAGGAGGSGTSEDGGAKPSGPAMAPSSVAPMVATDPAVGRVAGAHQPRDNTAVHAPHHQQLPQPQQFPQPQHMHVLRAHDEVGNGPNEFEQQQHTYYHSHQHQQNSLQQQQRMLPPHRPLVVVAADGHRPFLPHPTTEQQRQQQFSHQYGNGNYYDDGDTKGLQPQQQQQQPQHKQQQLSILSPQQQAAKVGQHLNDTDRSHHHVFFQERHRYDRAIPDDTATTRGVGAAPPPPNWNGGGNALLDGEAFVGGNKGDDDVFLLAHAHGHTREAADYAGDSAVVVDLPPDEALLSFAEAVASHSHNNRQDVYHPHHHDHGHHHGRPVPPPAAAAAAPLVAAVPAGGDGSFVPNPAHDEYMYYSSGTDPNAAVPQRRAVENHSHQTFGGAGGGGDRGVGRGRSRSGSKGRRRNGAAAAAGARARALTPSVANTRRRAGGDDTTLLVGGNSIVDTYERHVAATHSALDINDSSVAQTSDAAPITGPRTAKEDEEEDAGKRSTVTALQSSHIHHEVSSSFSSPQLFAEAEAHQALLNAAEHAQNAIDAIRSLVRLRGKGGGGGNSKYPIMNSATPVPPPPQRETKEEAFGGASTCTLVDDGVGGATATAAAASEAVAGAAAVASVAALEAQLRQLTSTKRTERFVTFALPPPSPALLSCYDTCVRQEEEEEEAQKKGDSAGHSKRVHVRGSQKILSYDSPLVGFYSAVERHGGWHGGAAASPPNEEVGGDRPTAEGVLALARRHAQLRAARNAVRRIGVAAATEAAAEEEAEVEGLAAVELRLNTLRQRMAVLSLAPSIAAAAV